MQSAPTVGCGSTRLARSPLAIAAPAARNGGFVSAPYSIAIIGVGKNAHSAFVGARLEEALDALGATTLVVCGVLTHNSLEATARHAGDLGYRVFVVADACWAVDVNDLDGRLWRAEDVHALSLD